MPDTATLICGFTNIENTDLVNLSVASIRARYANHATIPEGARAQINGELAEETDIVRSGDVIVFDMPTGTKG